MLQFLVALKLKNHRFIGGIIPLRREENTVLCVKEYLHETEKTLLNFKLRLLPTILARRCLKNEIIKTKSKAWDFFMLSTKIHGDSRIRR